MTTSLDQVNSVNKSVDAVKNDVSCLRYDFHQSIECMKAEVKGVQSTVNKLEGNVQVVESKLRSVEGKQSDFDQRLTLLSKNIQHLEVSKVNPSLGQTLTKSSHLTLGSYGRPENSQPLLSGTALSDMVKLSPDRKSDLVNGLDLASSHLYSSHDESEAHAQNVNYQTLDSEQLTRSLSRAMKQSRAPPPTPSIFKGEPAAYPTWRRSIVSLLDQEDNEADKLSHLQRYLSSELQNEFKGYLQYPDVASCDKVLEQLDKQFDDKHKVCMSFWLELENWPNIKHNDGPALQSFANHLIQMKDIAFTNSRLNFLNEPYTLKILIDKLPNSLASSFRSEANKYKKAHEGEYPSFERFVSFVVERSESENDAFLGGSRQSNNTFAKPGKSASKTALNTSTSETLESGSELTLTNEVLQQVILAMTNSTNINEKLTGELTRQLNVLSKEKVPAGYCPCCSKHPHTVDKCRFFQALEPDARVTKAIDLKLCLTCLKPNHISKECTSGIKCNHCQRKHNSLLHHANCMNQIKEELTSRSQSAGLISGGQEAATQNANQDQQSQQKQTLCSKGQDILSLKSGLSEHNTESLSTMIVPVYLSCVDNPSSEYLCYALLDSQSDATYIQEDLAHMTGSKYRYALLNVTTVTHKHVHVKCKAHYGLQIRGIDSSTKVALKEVYTRESLDLN